MKINNINWGYLFKSWIFTLLIGPIISQIIAFLPFFQSNQMLGIGLLGLYPMTLIFTFAFSIPTYIIFAFTYYYFSDKNLSISCTKAILISISVIGISITSAFITGILGFFFALSYSISSIMFGLIFNLDFKHEEEL